MTTLANWSDGFNRFNGPALRLFAHEGAAAQMSPVGLMVSDLTMPSP